MASTISEIKSGTYARAVSSRVLGHQSISPLSSIKVSHSLISLSLPLSLSLCLTSGYLGRMGGSVKDVQSKAELDSLLGSGAPVILHFWASWCEASKHMDQVFSHLSTDFPHVHFLRVRFFFSLGFQYVSL